MVFGHTVFAVEHEDRAHGKVDSSSQSGCGDDDLELVGLGKWLDQGGSLRIAHAAVVIGDALFERSGEFAASDGFLLGSKDDRVGFWQGGG